MAVGKEDVEILKPRIDKREYRRIVLRNSLQVLLISDPDTDKANLFCAAAMNVGVGSFCDPDGLEGLAHFLEHMLFYASEKYPLEDSYSKYITEHGGSTNAFAQFFIKPLMSADATMREIKAVDSEGLDKIQSLVEDKFQEIRNYDRSSFKFPGQPCTSEHLQGWMSSAPNEKLHLPAPNLFIPTDLSLKNAQEKVKFPVLLRSSSYSKLWYKPDTMFSTPKAYVKIDFSCPYASNSPEAELLADIFARLLMDYLNEYAYYAQVAGLYYVINHTDSGFEDPGSIDMRVEAFLKMFESQLYAMTNDEFQSNVNALIDMKLEKHKNLREESRFYWQEIADGTLKFDRREAEVAALRQLTQQELIDFFNENIKVGAPRKKTLSVGVYGNQHLSEFNTEKSEAVKPQTMRIEDIFSFKRSQPLYASFKGGFGHVKL
ncbi:hypothetical protein COLO4_28275 [Corchorus olitorius]|uniref:Peptidase M16 n=1 Tax=Corchorus olitorius TaxID=93759 RepID=A0A1R3HM12_9ROSI|nr:hypothetical protein COLO4_28275 [Corchorus olitorius]